MRSRYVFLLATALLVSICSCSNAQEFKRYNVQVVETLPHDVASYTQGLFFHDGQLYESAGQYGESSFRKVELSTGKVLKRENFDRKYFNEGACVFDGRLYILTWREGVCFVYDIDSWKRLGTLPYTGEGWGLTTDGESLIMSDGTSTLTFRDPESFMVRRSVKVTHEGRGVLYLNELEYIDGEIWANIYGSDLIVRIDPQSGKVKSVVNCAGLLPANLRKPSTDVLNGIAYNEADGSIYLTGKYWPKMYKVKLKEKKSK